MILFIFGLASCSGEEIRVIVVEGSQFMVVGEEQTLKATIRPISFDQDVIWESLDNKIASIDENGLVKALSVGKVEIIVTAVVDETRWKKFEITIALPEPEDVTIIGNNMMEIGDVQQLEFFVTPEFTSQSLTWQSSDMEVATVEQGEVTAISEGSTTITAISNINPEIFQTFIITVVLNNYQINYVLNEGINNDNNLSEYNLLMPDFTLLEPSRQKYMFLGWYETADFSGNPITVIDTSRRSDITLYAHWEKIIVTYEITYHVDGGILPDGSIVSFTELMTVTLPIPTKDGYDFLGWYETADFSGEEVKVIPLGTEGNKVFHAHWRSTEFIISYVLNGGINNEANPSSYNQTLEDIALLAPIRTNYNFLGWYETADFSGNIVNIIDTTRKENITLYAKWEKIIITYSITFYVNGGTLPEEVPSSYTELIEVLLPIPTKEEYFFGGWYDNEEFDGNPITVISLGSEGNKEYYAKWDLFVQTLELETTTTNLIEGDHIKINAILGFADPGAVILWSVSDVTILSVDNLGNVIALKPGVAKVIASIEGTTISAELELTVSPFVFTDTLVSKNATVNGTIITYNNCEYLVGKSAFTSFIDAISATKTGIVYVEAGSYSDSFTIAKSNITILGPNASINPNNTIRNNEAVLTGTITLKGGIGNIIINGLAFTTTAKINGSGLNTARLTNFQFLNNYVYNTTKATLAWAETNSYTEGFIFLAAATNYEMTSLSFINNKFDNVSNANINIAYTKDTTINGNVFHNFERDAVRFNNGGYNYGDIIIQDNDFINDELLGYNGIYFRIYGGSDSNCQITISQNIFKNIGQNTLYSGAISARNYQEKGAIVTIEANIFDNCYNYIRLRNNGTALNHASSSWGCNVVNNAFIGLPNSYYHINKAGSDSETTNPTRTVFNNNYYEDNDGNVITDLTQYASFFKDVVSFEGTLSSLIEVPMIRKQIELLEIEANYLVEKTRKQVVLNYFFPLSSIDAIGSEWSYKTGQDQSIHNLTTGVHLKEMLSYQVRTLVLTLRVNQLVVEREVEVNFGVLTENQTGLYYRNTPVAMSKDETGPAGSWIGWNGYTVTSNGKVLFMALDMVFKVETADQAKAITNLRYSSVAALLINSGTENIFLTKADITNLVATNSYAIISNGEIKINNTPTSFTLEPGDALFVAKFLDTLITNNPLSNAGNIDVGTEMIIKNWKVDPDAVVYTITYDLDGGDNDLSNPTTFTSMNLPIILGEPTKEMHQFKGWYDNPDFNGNPITVIPFGTERNLTLFAKWVYGLPAVKYTITYYLNDGMQPEVYPMFYTDQDTEPTLLPIPTKANYRFLGWYTTSNLTGDSISVIELGETGDKIYYAAWEEILPEGTYRITYNLNGGIWGYPSKAEMATDLLTDFYHFLISEGTITTDVNLNTFIHGEGKTSGFLGTYYNYCNPGYGSGYVNIANKFNSNSNEKIDDSPYFVNHPDYYDKWIGFFRFIDKDFIQEINNSQGFWIDPRVGVFRMWQYFANIKPASFVSDALMNSIPDFSPTKLKYTSTDEVIILPRPVQIGKTFEGWYDNPVFAGRPISLIPTGSSGDQVFYAKWTSELKIDLFVHPGGAGENVYQTLAEALAAAAPGAVIKLSEGTFNEVVTITKNNITIIGPYVDMDPNKNTRAINNEAIFIGTINIASGVSGLTIDGIAMTGAGKIVGSNVGGIDNFVFKNNYIYDSTISPASALIDFTVSSDTAKNTNLYFINNLFTVIINKAAPRYLKGGNIENLWIIDNVFSGGKVVTPPEYSDLIRLGGTNDSTTAGIGIAGQLIVKNNTFKNAPQRGLWVRLFTAYKVEIINNIFDNCGDQSFGAPLDLSNWGGAATQTTIVNILYNTFKNIEAQYAIKLGNAGATPNNYTSNIHYNKFIDCGGTKFWYITNLGNNSTALLNATQNYYDGIIPEESQFIGVGSFEGFYMTEETVPTLSDDGMIAPTEILINNSVSELVKFNGYQLDITVLPLQASDRRVIFTSSNPNIINVSSTGYLIGIGDGTVTITITSVFNPQLSTSFEVSVTTPERLEIRYETNSVVNINDEIRLVASIIPNQEGTIIWTSSDETIALVNSAGCITGLKAGVVTITATVLGKEDLTMSVEVTVVDNNEEMDALIEYFISINNAEILRQDKVRVTGYQFIYGVDIYGSVSNYFFATHEVIDQIVPKTNTNRPGTPLTPGVRYITIHDTASAAKTANAKNHANYMSNNTDGSTSWHYTVDDISIYQHLPDTERGNHAADSSHPYGEPWENGIGGGNSSSIGIETCVNLDSDLYQTWQRTAKLVANLLVTYGLTVNDVKQHYDFSRKNCPQTMRDNYLYDNFIRLVEAEYEILSKYADYTITFVSHNLDILANNGRIISRPKHSTTVSYTITVTKNNVSQSITLSSVVPGIYNTKFVMPSTGYPKDFIYTPPVV